VNQPEHVVPFTVKDNAIIVDGDVNGCPCRLLVDTGAGTLILDPAIVARAGIAARGTVRMHGFAAVDVPRLDGATVNLGTLSVACDSGAALPMARIQDARGPQVDGVIGYPLLARHAVEFDFPSRVLRFFPPDTAPARGSEAVLLLSIETRIPLISTYLVHERGDNVLARLVLDSGTTGDVDAVLSSEFVLAHPELLLGARDSALTAGGVGADSMAAVDIPVRELRLHTLRLPNPAVAIVGTEHMAFKSGDCDGTVSFSLFRERIITLNYPHRTVTVRKPGTSPALR
jgi:Aspartyl protease